MNAKQIEYDSSKLDGYLDEDLKLINDKNIWKEFKRSDRPGEETNDICYVYQAPNDPIWWIKFVAHVQRSSMENIDDLLDTRLKERHPEWHELYVDGKILQKNCDGRSEICYFQYSSPLFLIAPRDTCYVKVRRDLSNGFILSYRSIDVPEINDRTGKFVRTTFSGAHLIEKIENLDGFRYTYLQHANPGGSIPKALANRPQCDVIFREIQGIRRAMQKPFDRPVKE